MLEVRGIGTLNSPNKSPINEGYKDKDDQNA